MLSKWTVCFWKPAHCILEILRIHKCLQPFLQTDSPGCFSQDQAPGVLTINNGAQASVSLLKAEQSCSIKATARKVYGSAPLPLSRFLSFLLHLNFHSPSPKSQRSHLVISQPVRPKSLALLDTGLLCKNQMNKAALWLKTSSLKLKKKKFKHKWIPLIFTDPESPLCSLVMAILHSGSQNVSRIYG